MAQDFVGASVQGDSSRLVVRERRRAGHEPWKYQRMTRYDGPARLGDEMTATLGIDDIDGYGWTGSIETGVGNDRFAPGPVRVVLTDGEHAGRSADADLEFGPHGELVLVGGKPFSSHAGS